MWGKILVATRLERVVNSRFFQVWTDLVMNGLRPGDNAVSVRGLVAHKASNEAVRKLLKSDCDTLFLLDSDADIEPDFLSRFRDYEPGFDYDILQAFYPRRGWPPRPIWIQNNALGETMEMFITDPDTVQDVAIAGTHAALIKRHVFEQMLGGSDPENFDWFYYGRHRSDSEDGMFSIEAREHGFKIGATTHVKAGHIGELTTNWDSYQQYIDITGRRVTMERYKSLSLLIANFTGEAQDMVIAKSVHGNKNVKDAWELVRPDTPGLVRSFYGSSNNGYLYDLCNWNCQPSYEQLIAPLLNVEGKKVLVIGAGLGTEVEYLKDRNEVDVYELPGVLREFLRFRFGDDLNLLECNNLAWIEGPYDLIVAIDVIEHIHPDEIGAALDSIKRLLGNRGQFYYHNNFGQQDLYPMHYDHTELFNEWTEGLYETQMSETV